MILCSANLTNNIGCRKFFIAYFTLGFPALLLACSAADSRMLCNVVVLRCKWGRFGMQKGSFGSAKEALL